MCSQSRIHKNGFWREGAVPVLLVAWLTAASPARILAQSQTAHRLPPPAGVVWLVLVDDLHMDFRNTGRIREFLKSISTSLMGDQDEVVMRADRPSTVALGPTTDRTVFEAAVRQVAGSGLPPVDISEELKSPVSEIETRLAVTFSSASALLDTVAAVPERRHVMLYISNGYDSERGRALGSLFSRAAQQARVTVFTVNANGFRGTTPRSDTRVDAEDWKRVVVARRLSLREIAEPTGGFALLDDIEITDAMPRIRAALSPGVPARAKRANR